MRKNTRVVEPAHHWVLDQRGEPVDTGSATMKIVDKPQFYIVRDSQKEEEVE